MKYTPKQIEKYQRQRYITFLEKVTKNLFKMFRNENTTKEQFLKKFDELKTKLNEYVDIQLSSEYHHQMKAYIEKLYLECQHEFDFDDIREVNMSQLNRLQKLKNSSSYKKDKHKYKSHNQDWG
jgi:dihydroorotate dehydrogenase